MFEAIFALFVVFGIGAFVIQRSMADKPKLRQIDLDELRKSTGWPNFRGDPTYFDVDYEKNSLSEFIEECEKNSLKLSEGLELVRTYALSSLEANNYFIVRKNSLGSLRKKHSRNVGQIR